MSQLSYPINQPVSMLGMLADSRYKHTESMIASEAIPIGRAVLRVYDTEDQARLPEANQITMLYDADFVTSNSIAFTVSGVSITPVVFATDHDTTMAALVTAISGLSTVVSATATDTAGDNRTILILTNTDATASTTVTGGASQATGTPTITSTDGNIHGISQHTHSLESGLPGNTDPIQYPVNDVANVLRIGAIWTQFETAFDPDVDTLYVRFQNAGANEAIGWFRNDADSGDAVAVTGNIRVVSHLSAAGLGVIELNKPV